MKAKTLMAFSDPRRLCLALLCAVVALGADAAQPDPRRVPSRKQVPDLRQLPQRGDRTQPQLGPAQVGPQSVKPAASFLKPDLVPLQPTIIPNPMSGIAQLGPKLWAKNLGPGTLTKEFRWRVTCRIYNGEIYIGPCLYYNYPAANDATNPKLEHIFLRYVDGRPAPDGASVSVNTPNEYSWVNCNGGTCTITVEVDVWNRVDETNESNNTVHQWHQ